MTIEYVDAVNGDGLFDILGKYFHLLDTLNTARLTTVPDEAIDALQQLKLKTDGGIDLDRYVNLTPAADNAWRRAGDAYAQSIASDCEQILMQFVQNDSNRAPRSLTECLEYLIAQMEDESESVDASVPSNNAASADAGNSTNDLLIDGEHIRGDGKDEQNQFAETVYLEVTSIADPDAPVLSVKTDRATDSNLSEKWPAGSGVDTTITASNPSDSLLANSGFDDATIANIPDSWQVQSGTPGTDIVLTDVEVQTVTIAGTPTAGAYHLLYNDGSTTRSTVSLAYNASESDVQAALRALPGLESVTVSTTGTSPNFTHTITFTGVAGDVTTLTAVNNLDTGTVTPAESTAGEDSFRGRALRFDGDGRITQNVTLEVETLYACFFRKKKVSTPTGNLTIQVRDSAGGSVLTYPVNGSDIEAAFSIASLTTSWVGSLFPVYVARSVEMPVCVSIEVDTLASGSVLLDDFVLIPYTELYPGGLKLAVCAGVDAPIVGDKWTIAATNGRQGEFQTKFDQVFDMRGKGLLLPSDNSGTETIDDALIG